MNLFDLSTTAGSNTTIDGYNIAEGGPARNVNNVIRSLSAGIAKLLKDQGGALTTGGTGDAYTLTTGSAPAAYANGMQFAFKADRANTGAATLNVNSVGAKAIRKVESGADAALGVADITTNGHYLVQYDTAANSDAGAWILLNPSPVNLLFTQAGTGAIARTIDAKLKDGIRSIRDFGTSANWSSAMTAARAAAGVNEPVLLERGGVHAYAQNVTPSLYGADFKDALGWQMLAGTAASPATRHEPLIWVEKVSASTRTVIPGAWDQGAAYLSLDKRSGDAFGAAVTAFAQYTGGTGDLVGIHARTKLGVAGARGFGAWVYADIWAAPDRAIGMEINVSNRVVDTAWIADSAVGAITGLVISGGDGVYPLHQGIRFPNISVDSNKRLWTGIQFGRNSIMPMDISGNGEAIRIRGSSNVSGRYGGITLGDGSDSHDFAYGFRTVHASFADNAAAWLAKDHRIVWGSSAGAGTYITLTSANIFNIVGAPIAINGTQIATSRRTGWGGPTGTATRTTFATSTVTLEGLAQRVKALVDDMTTHGLIGA